MFTQTTNPMTCGMRKSQAVMTGDNEQSVIDAVAYYQNVSTPGMSTEARMERACYIFKTFGVSYAHAYS